MKRASILLCLAVFVLPAHRAWAECRFWAAVGERVPAQALTDGLLQGKNSLLALSSRNPDGWGIGFYHEAEPVVLRGKDPAYQDKRYREVVAAVSGESAGIIVAHVRQTSSGCRHVDDPHPFVRRSGGKLWMFGHNGTMDKGLLISLIGREYFDRNPPETCVDDPPVSWVDSELYFIFILKKIEEAQGDVEAGIKNAVRQLGEALGSRRAALNFFLTDGNELWAFRRGHTLFYRWDVRQKYTLLASMYTPGERGDWAEVPEGALLVIGKNIEPYFAHMTQ